MESELDFLYVRAIGGYEPIVSAEFKSENAWNAEFVVTERGEDWRDPTEGITDDMNLRWAFSQDDPPEPEELIEALDELGWKHVKTWTSGGHMFVADRDATENRRRMEAIRAKKASKSMVTKSEAQALQKYYREAMAAAKAGKPAPPKPAVLKKKATKKKATKKKATKKASKKTKIATNRCARKGSISSKARKRLPDKAFGLPEVRKYPLYKLGGDGKLSPSGTHAQNAKARAKRELDKGNLTTRDYLRIVRKANKVLASCGGAVKKAKRKAQARGRRRALSAAEQRKRLNAAIKAQIG